MPHRRAAAPPRRRVAPGRGRCGALKRTLTASSSHCRGHRVAAELRDGPHRGKRTRSARVVTLAGFFDAEWRTSRRFWDGKTLLPAARHAVALWFPLNHAALRAAEFGLTGAVFYRLEQHSNGNAPRPESIVSTRQRFICRGSSTVRAFLGVVIVLKQKRIMRHTSCRVIGSSSSFDSNPRHGGVGRGVGSTSHEGGARGPRGVPGRMPFRSRRGGKGEGLRSSAGRASTWRHQSRRAAPLKRGKPWNK